MTNGCPLSGHLRVCALLLGSCLAFPAAGADGKPPASAKGCGIEGFRRSPNEHILVDLEKPLRVRSVEGVITSQGGGWPEGTLVTFELRPLRKSGKIKQVKVDGDGAFKMPDVPPGEYCFKATANGWQSVVGVVVVTDAADSASRVSLEMLLGV